MKQMKEVKTPVHLKLWYDASNEVNGVISPVQWRWANRIFREVEDATDFEAVYASILEWMDQETR